VTRHGWCRMVACFVLNCTGPTGFGHATAFEVPWVSLDGGGGVDSPLSHGSGSAAVGRVDGPVSVSVSPGPLEYFSVLVRTSGSILFGLSRAVQALFRK
jgi:hypothetical protein